MLDLIARLESADGPSRELDAEIAATLRIPPNDAPNWLRNWAGDFAVLPGFTNGRVCVLHADGSSGVNWHAPAYTASIDAALTLMEPGTEWEASTLYGLAQVSVGLNFQNGPESANRKDGNVILALVTAILRSRVPANGGG